MKKIVLFWLVLVNVSYPLFSAETKENELRGQIASPALTTERLKNLGANGLNSYSFTDHIYLPKESRLSDEYYRIRDYEYTGWHQKSVNLAHKKADLSGVGMRRVSFQEYDRLEQAKLALPQHLDFLFSYRRRGHEYAYAGFKIYVEEIENFPPTVEVVSTRSIKEIKQFMKSIGVTFFYDKSVPSLILAKFNDI